MDNGLSSRLKTARKNSGKTQKEVCDKLGISIGTLSGYERNYREPDKEMIIKLAEVYNVTVGWLINNEENNRDDKDFQDFISDPELQVWYKELPKSDEEELRRLKEVWEIIKRERK